MPSPISILPITANDIPAAVDVEMAAFAPHPRIPMLWRGGYTPAVRDYFADSKAEALQDAEFHLVKAVDDTGEVVGVAEWSFRLDPKTRIEEEVRPQPGNWPACGDWAMQAWFEANTAAMLTEFLGGRGYIFLETLTIHPAHQRRGIGAALLAWGVQQADERGVAMCLESTPEGLTLYSKFGFKVMREIRKDMRDFGWEEIYDEEAARRVFMVRAARLSSLHLPE